MVTTDDLTLSALKTTYAAGKLTPTALCETLLAKIAASHAIFISKPRPAEVMERCKFLEALPADQRGPLWGIPFAVKDNIDVAGLPTTCACPDFSYTPECSARTVQQIVDAGAICLGKTNLDQFACGLVGTRTPYGIPCNAFDDRFTPGGSSSGSAVAVAEGIVTFALGTDTAGSGRVPAGQNGVVGIKPSLGRWSAKGVVPACYTLDCVSVFALTVEDGAAVARLLDCSDVSDPTWRPRRSEMLQKTYAPKQKFKFAIPSAEFMSFAGPGGDAVARAMEAEMAAAAKRLKTIGGEQLNIDFSSFAETAVLLYGGPFVAERYSGIRSFLEARAPGLEPPELADLSIDQRLLKVTRSIISKTENWSAADVYEAQQHMSFLRAAARAQLAKIDLLVVPTAAYNYTVREIMEEEDEQDYQDMLSGKAMVTKNANLGRFTNFVNLLDMCGVSVPSGLLKLGPAGQIPSAPPAGKKMRKTYSSKTATANGAATSSEGTVESPSVTHRAEHLAATGNPNAVVPFGITLLAPAWTDEYVAGIAAAYEKATGLRAGPLGHGVTPYRTIGIIRPRKPTRTSSK
jgi:allophanate hydrolase